MTTEIFIPLLSFGTLVAVAAFAYISRKRTLARMKDDDAPKSTLASDADSHGKPADV